ncbi:cupin domain-containing protein [Sciscionella sediminilitoris]|uniref:cupin domain-containing protein n=1 Tax=Sciscionella sediminilitoris TaxID=1445613 RepID=UPI0004DF62FB|nr:cupin domain-containing protein [Sciscionella sp. SE31]
MKAEYEFFPAGTGQWQPTAQHGVTERVLSRDPEDPEILTRLANWAPGLDTSAAGVITHDYVEEVYLLEGELHDLTLGKTFRAGEFAMRRPGMPHGPYRTGTGCVMLETRYR